MPAATLMSWTIEKKTQTKFFDMTGTFIISVWTGVEQSFSGHCYFVPAGVAEHDFRVQGLNLLSHETFCSLGLFC